MKKSAFLFLSFSLLFMTPFFAMEEGNQEDARVKNVKKAVNSMEANRIHSAEIRKRENAQMITLISEGKIDAALIIHRSRILRENAEYGGILMIHILHDGTGEQIAAATEFNRGIAARLARIQAQTLPISAPDGATSAPSMTQIPPSS